MTLFSKKTFEFLMENRFRDDREWFRENRGRYEAHVLAPLQDFVSALSPVMLDIDGKLITEPKVDRTISRVYRDTRFSKDKSLYRDVMWCTFMRDKKLYHGPPAFFFELSPDRFRYGCGYYQADPKEMQALRDLILEDHAAFRKAAEAYRRQNHFVLEGELYKRSKYPEEPPEKQDWLNRKNQFLTHNSTDFDLLYSAGLADVVGEKLRLLQPVYEFFLEGHARAPR